MDGVTCFASYTHIYKPSLWSVEQLPVPMACCPFIHLHKLCCWDRNNPAAVRSSLVSVVVVKKKCQWETHPLLRGENKTTWLHWAVPHCIRGDSCNNPPWCSWAFMLRRSTLPLEVILLREEGFSSWPLVKKKPCVFLGVWVSLLRLARVN